MQTLFAISVLCFVGILWAALALARHIKAGPPPELSIAPAQSEFKQYILAAHESSQPSALFQQPLVAERFVPEPGLASSQTPAEFPILARITPSPNTQAQLPDQATKPIVEPRPVFDSNYSTPRNRHNDLNQSARDIAANKQWVLPPHALRSPRLFTRRVPQPAPKFLPNTVLRKPPQPARHGTIKLLDPAYFNKDMGDLTDPYQPPRTSVNGRNQPAPRKRY